MCLLTVDKRPMRKFGIGYKQVQKLKDGTYVCFDHIPHAGTVAYPLNQWITDPNDGDVMSLYCVGYRTGFHISLSRQGLKYQLGSSCFPIIKVKFRKVTATSCAKPDPCYGRQVVAREIMNLGEVD